MGNVMDYLLIKAKLDKSKLVQVQRSVTRNGKTFMQNFWVSPSQVRKTDRVIGNAQNLLPPKVAVPTPPVGVLDKAYFDSIKSDHTKAMSYLKSCGITWNDHTHPGVNWMRACMALNVALGVQNTPKNQNPTQPTSQTATQSAQFAQPKQQGSLVLTAQQQSDLDAGKNGKEKVIILKKMLGNDGCVAYAKQLGITWNEHQHPGINIMRMSMSLKDYFDAADGTVSPASDKKVGAPDGNQNAKKDDVQQPVAPTPPPSDKLEIPANATERQKNLINLINGIDDVSTLELVQKSGFVPEDAQAQDFVKKKLWEEYNIKFVNLANTNSMYYRYGNGFSKDASELVSKIFKGLPKKLIKQVFDSNNLSSDNFMFQMVIPGEKISITDSMFKSGNNTFNAMMNRFAKLSAYDNNDFSCMGARSNDDDALERSKIFSLKKEGFVRLLNHIGDTQPELKSETEKMIQEYGELMKLCKNDPIFLQYVVNEDFSSIKEAHETYELEDSAIKILKSHMKSNGFTDTEVDATLSSTNYFVIDQNGRLSIKESRNAGYNDFKLDENGHKVTIDLQTIMNSDGKPVSEYLNTNFYKYTRSMSQIYSGFRTTAFYDLSEDDYNKIIDLSCKLFGTKIVDKTTHDVPLIPASRRTSPDNKMCTYIPDLNDERAAIMMNLSYINQGLELHDSISDLTWMCPPSNANKQGSDYTGNFNYYQPGNGVSFGNANSRFASKVDELAQVDKQLQQIRTFSMDYHKKLVDYVKHEGNSSFMEDSYTDYKSTQDAKAASVSLGAKKLSFTNASPAMDIFINQLIDAAVYCPQNFNTKVNTPEKLSDNIHKTLGYTDYTFKNYDSTLSNSQQLSGIRNLREQAFANAKCSLAFVDPTTRQAVEHEVKINFDRVDANGKRVHKAQRVYDDRTLVFHSGVYEVKNSQAEEAFNEEAKRLGEVPKHTYHGTSYSGACGVVGIDGRFRFLRSDLLSGQTYTGDMLGDGIYVAKMTGKNCPYIGNNKYSYTNYTASDLDTKNKADGVLLVCDTVFGKYGEFSNCSEAKRNNKNNGGSYDSVAVGAGALMSGGNTLREYECIVTRQNMIAPKYLVDCGARRR